jgi:hypothetical protein
MFTASQELKIKDAVRERDKYRCRACCMSDKAHRKQYGRGLEVHRVLPGSAYSLEGCITLCASCHDEQPTRLHVRVAQALSKMPLLVGGYDKDHTQDGVRYFPHKAEQMLASFVRMFRERTGLKVTRSMMLFAIVSEAYDRVAREGGFQDGEEETDRQEEAGERGGTPDGVGQGSGPAGVAP